MDAIGESMASQTKASKIKKLTALPGVGAATAAKLVDAKLDTVSKIAAAAKSADKAASASKAVANKAKSAAKKAPAKAKATASKAKAAAKKTPAKAKQAAESVKNLAKNVKSKTVKKDNSGAKRVGPSPNTPLSKMSWFKNFKK